MKKQPLGIGRMPSDTSGLSKGGRMLKWKLLTVLGLSCGFAGVTWAKAPDVLPHGSLHGCVPV